MSTILAIDDKSDNLVALSALLKMTMPDANVLTARSGPEGIAKAKAVTPDVILLDIVMPEMDGYEVCRRLRTDRDTRHLPIILLTALETGTHCRIKGLRAGADAFLIKPIDEGELSAQINVMLRTRRAESLLLEERNALDTLVRKRTLDLERANRDLCAELVQRKQVEESLRLSEETLRKSQTNLSALIENTDGFIWSVDRDYCLIQSNSQFDRLFTGLGHQPLAPGDKVLASGFPPEVLAEWRGYYDRALAGEMVYLDCHRPVYDPSQVIEYRFNPICGDDGTISGATVYGHDITDRKQAEEALNKSEIQYKELIDESILGIAIAQDGRYVYVNSAYANLIGYSVVDVLNLTPSEIEALLHPDDLEKIRKRVEDRLGGKPLSKSAEYRYIHRNGTLRYVNSYSRNVLFNDRPAIQITVEDITERRKAEQEKEKTEGRFRAIFNKSFQFSLILDKEGNVLKMNDLCHTVCGPLAETAIGKPLWEAAWWQDFSDVQEKTKSAIQRVQAEEGVSDEVTFIDKDRQFHHGMRIFSPIRDNGGELSYISVVGLDITERKKADESRQHEFAMRKTLLDSIPLCIAMILKKGTREIVASNKAAQEIGAIPGVTCYSMCSQRDDPCPWCLGPECWATDEYRRREIEYRGAYYEGIWMPLTDELYVHYIFDISERKQVEQ